MSGGSSNSAQRAAEAAERERQAQIRGSVGRINEAFDNPNRQREIGDYLGATRQFYMNDLNRQKGETDRLPQAAVDLARCRRHRLRAARRGRANVGRDPRRPRP